MCCIEGGLRALTLTFESMAGESNERRADRQAETWKEGKCVYCRLGLFNKSVSVDTTYELIT